MIAIYASILTGLTGWVIAGVEIFILVPIAALAIALISIFLLPFKSTRDRAFKILSVTAVVTVMFPIIIFSCMKIRMAGFHLAAIRAEPLVAAIGQFVTINQRPPNSLDELVPEYIDAIPSRPPHYDYVIGTNAQARYLGNDWVLDATVNSGLINWDRFMYFPLQNYPKRGYGGTIVLIRDWAYVLE